MTSRNYVYIYMRVPKQEAVSDAIDLYNMINLQSTWINRSASFETRNRDRQKEKAAFKKAMLKPKYLAKYLDVSNRKFYVAYKGEIYKRVWVSACPDRDTKVYTRVMKSDHPDYKLYANFVRKQYEPMLRIYKQFLILIVNETNKGKS